MKLPIVVAVSLAAAALSGCTPARLVAVPVSPKARLEMGETAGIPYYVPRPYLLVTRDFVIDDAALTQAGVVPGAALAGSGKAATNGAGTSGTSGTSGAAPRSGVSSVDDEGGEAPAVQAKPSYSFRIVYLPDLSRQYALQQRGGILNNVQVKYALEGGWMFTGTEISSETRAVEAIEATSSGVANILGSSLEQVFASLFPIPVESSGVSGVGGGGGNEDLTPRMWLFEIADGPQGTLHINTERPFFEWPKDSPAKRRRPPVDLEGSDPDMDDVRRPPATRPTLPPPGPTAPRPTPSTRPGPSDSATPVQPTPGPTSPSPGMTPAPYPP